MGQPLSAAQQQALREHPEVFCVTPEHIYLKNGAVLDPSDFVIGSRRLFLIRKLLRCGCQPWQLHKPGRHVVIEVTVQRTILGNIRTPIEHLHPCKQGEWTTEETLTEEQAKHCGLLQALDARPGRP